MFFQLIASGLINGSVYALVALGMTVLYRSTGIVNFCHGEFFMLGAFAVLIPLQSLGFPYFVAIVFSVLFLFVVGASIERLLMRPLQFKHASHLSLAMMTIALSYLFQGIAQFFYGRKFEPLQPLIHPAPVEIGNVILLPQDILTFSFTVLVIIGFFCFFQLSNVGKKIQASSRSPRAASLVGINVPLLRNTMWGVGAALGAIAGILIAPSTLVYPYMGVPVLIKAFAAMTLGGFGSLLGAVLGAFGLGIMENLVGGYLSTSLVSITSYLVIVIVLIVRPQGLVGEWKPGRG